MSSSPPLCNKEAGTNKYNMCPTKLVSLSHPNDLYSRTSPEPRLRTQQLCELRSVTDSSVARDSCTAGVGSRRQLSLSHPILGTATLPPFNPSTSSRKQRTPDTRTHSQRREIEPFPRGLGLPSLSSPPHPVKTQTPQVPGTAFRILHAQTQDLDLCGRIEEA